MALTAAQTKELYQFFNVAFNAAPGVTYMGQLYDARQVMTMEEVVEVFTTKTEFTSTYPNFLTDNAFATKLVDNVVGDSATDAAKATAVADIEAALALGWSRGKVIYTIFGNLANKETTDADWGTTATQFANQVAVAQYYTETLLVDTTDTAKLKAAIAGVDATTDVSSAAAIETILYAAGATTDVAGEFTTDDNEAVAGTPADDAFEAILGQTLQDGDSLDGGAGSDTLTIRAGTGFGGSVEIENVETININLRSGTTLDMAAITGVSGVNVTDDSASSKTLSLSNASLTPTYGVAASGTTLVISPEDAENDDDSVSLVVSANGVTVDIGAGVEDVNVAATYGATGSLALDTTDGAAVAVTGSGTLTLDLTAASSLSVAGFSGSVTVDASDAAAAFTYVGSEGTDKVTVSGVSTDTLNGGSGSDTLTLSLASGISVTSSGVQGFETLALNGTGTTTVAIRNSGIETVNVTNASNETTFSIALDDAATINFGSGASLGSGLVYLGLSGGVADVNVLATGTQALSHLRVSGADSLDVSATSSGAVTIALLEADNGVEEVTVSGTKNGVAITRANVSGVTDLTLVGNGTGDVVITTLALKSGTNNNATQLESISLTQTGGTGGVTQINGAIIVGSGLDSLVLSTDSGTVSVNTVSGAAGGNNLVVDIDVTATGTVGTTGTGIEVGLASGDIAADVTVGVGGAAYVSGLDAGSGDLTFSGSVSTSGLVEVGDLDGFDTTVDLVLASGSEINVDKVSGTDEVSLTIAIAAAGNASALVTDVEASGLLTLDLSITGSGGEIDLTAVSAGSMDDFSFTIAGGSGSISIPALVVAGDVGDVTLTVGAGASAGFTNIDVGGALGDIVLAGAGNISLGQVSASSIGDVSIGASTELDSFQMTAGSIGDITVSTVTGADSIVLELVGTAASIGDIALAGSANSLAILANASASTVGDITISSNGETTLGFSAIDGASSAGVKVDSITVTGGSGVTVNLGSALTVSGAITLNLVGTAIVNGSGTIGSYVLGAGTHSIDNVGAGEVLVLTTGTGTSTITLASAASAVMFGSGFDFGTDVLKFEIELGMGSASLDDSGAAMNVVVVTGASADLTANQSAAAAATAATDVIVLATGTYANISAALAYIGSGYANVDGEVLWSANNGASAFAVLYEDTDGNTYLYVVDAANGSASTTFTGTTSASGTLVATFTGLDLTAVSGADFADSFFAG